MSRKLSTITLAMPMHVSNVMIVDPKRGVGLLVSARKKLEINLFCICKRKVIKKFNYETTLKRKKMRAFQVLKPVFGYKNQMFV